MPGVGLALVLATLVVSAAADAAAQAAAKPALDIIFVPTPKEVVDAMLKVARVTAEDVIYDLGSGDGRIPITAAKVYGARGVGIDLDPERVAEANQLAAAAGVTNRVTFVVQDLFTTDISPATVVTLYLLPSLNVRLIPKLNQELKPGTRVVSHAFDMGGIPPKETLNINGRTVYLWTTPILPVR
jgi:SAM-dependent methyltransferase